MTSRAASASALREEQLGTAFRKLAEEYAAESDEQNEATWAKIEQRSSLRTSRLAARPIGNHKWLLSGLALAAACLFGLWFIEKGDANGSFSYSVNGAVQSAALDTAQGQVIASEEAPMIVALRDRVKLSLEPHTTLRLKTDRGARAITTRLLQGEAAVEPRLGSKAELRFEAGSFKLRPLAASFVFGYTPGDERIAVTTSRGVVVVIDSRGVEHRVESGAQLSLPLSPSPKTVTATSEEEPKTEGVVAKTTARPNPTPPSFRALAAQGNFEEIVRVAQSRGVSQVLASASATELQELGQAARYTGNTALASRTWTRMTQRFSGASGRNAHFFLGRLAEQQGTSGPALRHYDAYLRGGSGGVYSAEALARKLSIVNKSHGAQKARPIAREYLRRFPQGAYAETARELAGGE